MYEVVRSGQVRGACVCTPSLSSVVVGCWIEFGGWMGLGKGRLGFGLEFWAGGGWMGGGIEVEMLWCCGGGFLEGEGRGNVCE